MNESNNNRSIQALVQKKTELESQLESCSESEKSAIYLELISTCNDLRIKLSLYPGGPYSSIGNHITTIKELLFDEIYYKEQYYNINSEETIEHVQELLELTYSEHHYLFQESNEVPTKYTRSNWYLDLCGPFTSEVTLILNNLKKIDIIVEQLIRRNSNRKEYFEFFNLLGDINLIISLLIVDHEEQKALNHKKKAKVKYNKAKDYYDRNITYTDYRLLPILKEYFKTH